MLEGQEGLNWTDTGMLNYYHLKFPVGTSLME